MRLWRETTGAGVPLYLIHGWGMNASVWDPLLATLNDAYQVTRVDLPGHGNSPLEENQQELSDWSTALMEAAPENAIWLGWSLGGLLALHAASRLQTGIRALYLMTATPCFAQRDNWSCAMPLATLQQFADNLEEDSEATLMRFLSLQIKGSEQSRELLKQLRSGFSQRPAAQQSALKTGLDFLRETDLRDELAALKLPLHCTFGERDTLVPACASKAVSEKLPAASLPNVSIQLIKGAGHVPFLSHGDACLGSLQQLAERSRR